MGVTVFTPQRNLKQKLVGELIFYSDFRGRCEAGVVSNLSHFDLWGLKIKLRVTTLRLWELCCLWRDRWHNAALASLSFPYHNWVLVLCPKQILLSMRPTQNFNKHKCSFFCLFVSASRTRNILVLRVWIFRRQLQLFLSLTPSFSNIRKQLWCDKI